MPLEFACHAARSQRAAVNIGGSHQDLPGTTGKKKRLSNGKRLQQRKASAADVESVAVLAQGKTAMENRGKRRISVVRLAGRHDPIDVLRLGMRIVQGFAACHFAERAFIFVFGGVSEGMDTGAGLQLPRWHAEGFVDFFGRNDTGAKSAGRTDYVHGVQVQSTTLFTTGSPWSSKPLT